jgi:4,4'-diaponeurosporenoate glycosyltransferase
VNWGVVAGLVVGWVLVHRARAVPTGTLGAAERDHVAVVIPARDEEANLPHLLDDLAAVTAPPLEVIVVDDDSTDGTAEVADREGVHLIRSSGPPPGWAGKPHACHLGAVVAERVVGVGGVVVFLDADVRLDPDAIARLTAVRAQLSGGVSVQPSHVALSWREQLSAVFNLVAVMAVGVRSSHPAGMFGPVVCCRLVDYVAVGGHRSVRTAVIEDLALGRRFVDAGIPVHLFVGEPFRFRMYPHGWGSQVEGWTKNIALGAAATVWWRVLAVGWWIGALIMATVDVVGAPWGSIAGLGWAVGTYLLAASSVASMLRRVGRFRPAASLAFPLLVAGFLAVFGRSLWCTWVRRSVTWRSRRVPLGADRRKVRPT